MLQRMHSDQASMARKASRLPIGYILLAGGVLSWLLLAGILYIVGQAF
jgi:hypothetical protein